MKGMVLFFGIAIFASLILAANTDSFKAVQINNKEQNKNTEFSTFTLAVCENKEDSVYCRDEVFVNCNEHISKLGDFNECDGIKIEIPKATGFAVFDKSWKDPRV